MKSIYLGDLFASGSFSNFGDSCKEIWTASSQDLKLVIVHSDDARYMNVQ